MEIMGSRISEGKNPMRSRPSAKTKSPSLNLFSLLYPQTQKNEIEVSLKYGIAWLFHIVL